MKRYAVFGFADYYPSGGWGDLWALEDDIEVAFASTMRTKMDGWMEDNYQIIDLEAGEEISREISEALERRWRISHPELAPDPKEGGRSWER